MHCMVCLVRLLVKGRRKVMINGWVLDRGGGGGDFCMLAQHERLFSPN